MDTATKFGVFGTIASQFGKLFRRRRLTPRQEARIQRAVIEALEPVLLLCSFNSGTGEYSAVGTSGADTFKVWQNTFESLGNAVGIVIRVNGTDCIPYLASSVTKVTISALAGADSIFVERDNDHPLGFSEGVSAPTSLLGGSGNDTIDGGDLADTILGYDEDSDLLHGHDGNDLMYGGYGGADEMYGDEGNDTMYGGSGANNNAAGDDDFLQGDAGNDYLYGEYGGDTLRGEAGADVMYGGDGNDEFHSFDFTVDNLFGGAGTDTATDRDGNDVLDSIENT